MDTEAPAGRGKALGAVAALATLLIAAIVLPVKDWLLLAIQGIQDAGPAGAVAFALLYIVATVGMLPGSVLTLAAGFLYGPLWGFLLVWVASNTAAAIAFVLGRTLLRDRVESWVADRPRFRALDKAMGDEGLRLVLLLRLSPLFPFNIINYGLGLTRLKLHQYVIGSVIGMAPGTLLFVYLGSTVSELGQLVSGGGDAGSSGQILYWAGLASTLLVTVLVTRAARRALEQELEAAA